jgi:hypothetical protein
MSTMSPARPMVKTTRRTARPSAPFGAGIDPIRTRFEPSDEDRAAAAVMFGDDADWDARMAADANGEECEVCGRPVERCELQGGLCNACQIAAEEAAVACL